MFRVKLISLCLSGIFLFGFLTVLAGQSVEQKFEENLEKANAFLNIDSDSLLHYANTAYFEAKVLHNPHLQIDAIVLVINAQIKLGKYSQAILSCLRADSITAANQLINRNHEIMMYKGLVFQNAGFVSEGLDYLFKAEKQMEVNGELKIEGDLFYYIALAHFNINEFNTCRNYAREAVIIEQRRNNMPGLVKNYILLANSFNNIDSIQKYLSKAKVLLNMKEMEYKKAIFLTNEALLFKSIGKIDSARSSYLEAINISTK